MIILHDIMIHPLAWKHGLHYQTCKLLVKPRHQDGKWQSLSSLQRMLLARYRGIFLILS